MKNSSNKIETQPSDKRESIELLPKNEIIIDKQVITGNVTYHISVENLITAQKDETRKSEKKSCLERLKEIHVAFKILAALIGIFITLSPFIPKIIDETSTMAKSDVFILVIPYPIDGSYLQNGDGTSQIYATINAPQKYYARNAAFALVNGQLHVFGGMPDGFKGSAGFKIARLGGCSLKEIPVRLNEKREWGHAAVSIENERKALVCFGDSNPKIHPILKSCEIFDGSSTISTFAAEWTHQESGLALFNNQPATVGCRDKKHRKAETLSSTGWTALPIILCKQIESHSLVGLENGAILLLGGWDWGSTSTQTGIWQLKKEWTRIGELSKPACCGSAIYVGRSVYYFEKENLAIHRIDLDNNEELEAVEQIGSQPERYWNPVLFQTDGDSCD